LTPTLTMRELEIADMVALGFHNKNIAHRLGISEGTVKAHLHHVYEKLEISSRWELAAIVRESDLFLGRENVRVLGSKA
jgi:two-component system, NarL family, nitrate/nitrite response regulator NarL